MTLQLPAEFERFLHYLRRNKRQAESTVTSRTVALRSYTAFCRARGVDPVHPGCALLDWQASLDHAPGTVANYTQAVTLVFRWLASRAGGRVLGENPAEDLPRIHVITPQTSPIDDDDLDLALRAAEATDRRLYCWLLLEAGCGIRPVQTASLTRQRVRYEPSGRASLTVTGKGRTMVVVAGPDIAAELRQWTRGERGALWFHEGGGPVRGRHIYTAVNAHLRRLGIDGTSHSLRRWFGKHAYQLTGKDMRSVQELLGHADPRTTMRYIPADEQGRGEVADLLSARLVRRSAS